MDWCRAHSKHKSIRAEPPTSPPTNLGNFSIRSPNTPNTHLPRQNHLFIFTFWLQKVNIHKESILTNRLHSPFRPLRARVPATGRPPVSATQYTLDSGRCSKGLTQVTPGPSEIPDFTSIAA
ncbi:hypothetical protein V490_04802 [Pseudogymnoascus sp. VKM F-3557]|nr:hypothetical protein V490_04802 [Pseudogymnoascus sp. VKM F-3557]